MKTAEVRPLSFEAYENFVETVRNPDPPEFNWRKDRAKRVGDELLEVLVQHGDGLNLLLPSIVPVAKPKPGLVHKMADELGDSCWFITDATLRAQLSLSDVTTAALQRHVGSKVEEISTFRELDIQSVNHAATIAVPNKYGLSTYLGNNPSYLLMRTQERLIRSLNPDSRITGGPPTATYLEGVTELPQALGDACLALSFIASARLGVSLEAVARFNMRKLTHRQAHGKENDLSFTDFLAAEQ
ncbi:hypothetical protein EYC59_02580 [Candidatus Saccharibacteria bacterium]|nr:MAG: hypothetical protein EYC59_02580 [Candidatus Saccharibacteria bacterium]